MSLRLLRFLALQGRQSMTNRSVRNKKDFALRIKRAKKDFAVKANASEEGPLFYDQVKLQINSEIKEITNMLKALASVLAKKNSIPLPDRFDPNTAQDSAVDLDMPAAYLSLLL